MMRHEMVVPRPSSPSRGVAQMTTPNQRARISQPLAITSMPKSSSRHNSANASGAATPTSAATTGRTAASLRAAIALHVDSEIRRGRDYVRKVVIVATVDAADVAEALDLAWWTFRKAAGEDLAGWALADAEAEVRPEGR